MAQTADYDIVVVGSGPAGATTARWRLNEACMSC